MTQAQFKEFYNLHFGLPLRNNILGKLINLKKTTIVEEYHKKFQALLARASSVRNTSRLIFSLPV